MACCMQNVPKNVGGVQVYAEGETTGELPGKLVRGAQHPVARVS